MDLQTAQGVAARIWCDSEYDHVVMDVELADKIAKMLLDYANTASPPAAGITYPCAHCHEPVEISTGAWLDSGTIFYCPNCGKPTVVELRSMEER